MVLLFFVVCVGGMFAEDGLWVSFQNSFMWARKRLLIFLDVLIFVGCWCGKYASNLCGWVI